MSSFAIQDARFSHKNYGDNTAKNSNDVLVYLTSAEKNVQMFLVYDFSNAVPLRKAFANGPNDLLFNNAPTPRDLMFTDDFN